MKKNGIKQIFVMAIVLAVVILLEVAGIYCAKWISNGMVYCLICFGVILGLGLVNVFGSKVYRKKIDQMKVDERFRLILSRREDAIRNLDMAIKRLHIIQIGIIVYFMLLFTLASAMVFFEGTEKETNYTIFVLIAFYINYGLLYRISAAKEKFDDTGYSVRQDYPTLYKIADRAAKELGVSGEIRICILPNCNAGIQKIGDTYSLEIGAILLNILSEEELFQVLLHEFSHMADPYRKEKTAPMKYICMLGDESASILEKGTIFLLMLPIEIYSLEYGIYDAISSEIMEQRADEMVKNHGHPYTFMSALAKIVLFDFFDDQIDEYMTESFYASELPRTNQCSMIYDSFLKILEEKKEFWIGRLAIELPHLVDTHPTFRQRHEAMGNCGFDVEIRRKETPYCKECQKAISYIDKEMYDRISKEYESERKEYYLKPLSIVKEWEKSDQKLPAEEMAPIVNAYASLGRFDEAEAICDQIIKNTENIYATAQALFFKGSRMLKREEKEGISLIYRAIEINKNYINEGMNEVGRFCCKMGYQEELEEYRSKLMELAQQQMDLYDKAGELSKADHLEKECFPDDRLPKMLDFMVGIGEGMINRIFLVRKIINKDYFSSVFLIDFEKETDEEKQNEVMGKIFNYLDTYPDGWQYSLFLYDKNDKQIEKKLKKVPGSCVYEREKNNIESGYFK